MALIELKNIAKTYYIGAGMPVPALKSTSLKIEAGEFVAIMGPSGSGKSTLLAILGLLDKADHGEYQLLGRNITRLSDNEYARLRNRFFGFVFQMFNLLPRLNVVGNVMLPFIYAGNTSSRDREEALKILNKIGMSDRLRHRPNELSGGQQQRVAIARALANRPLVILADEPTGNLDSKSSAEIINLLTELNRQGNTIIMVTHEPDLAGAATRTITLHDGEIISDEKKAAKPAISIGEDYLKRQPRRRWFSLSGLRNYVWEATVTLLSNRLRSFLSILGVMIGVAAVIAMLAVGTGAKMQVEKSLSALGTNLLMVRSSFAAGGIALGTETVTRFTFADLAALKGLDSVKAVVPYVSGRAQAVYQNRNWSTQVMGASEDYQNVRDAVPERGRFFTAPEVAMRSKVAVLGAAVAKELFADTNPLGKQIRINRINFKVIGVMPEKGVAGFRNVDDQIVVPVTTAMYRLLGTDYINYFDVEVSDADSMPLVEDAIPPLITRLHRLPDTQAERIEVRNFADIQKTAGEMAQTFSLLLGSIAAVSLLVGGIGIMNIMLVMVMERTREIGLRKALGAENRDIMTQFLVEGVLICLLGGVIGITLGSLVSGLISAVAGWSILISAGSVVLAFTFSILTGLIFSLWPAWRATRLLPIVALRYE